MRIRSIKPEFFKHDELGGLTPLARLLFIGLWCMADCAGRLEDRPKRIKAEILPYEEDCDCNAILSDLARIGVITRYEVDGQKLIEIPQFARHQRITGKESESESRFPGCKKNKTGKQRGNNGETPEKQPVSLEGKGRETEGKGDVCANDSHDIISDLKAMPVFQCINVDLELQKMKAWLATRPQRKLTLRFATNWLTKALADYQTIALPPDSPPMKNCVLDDERSIMTPKDLLDETKRKLKEEGAQC